MSENRTLLEETIAGMSAEGAFDMAYWSADDRARQGKCGTACCMAGHIQAAAARLGASMPDTGVRGLWSEAYGVENGNRLDFYNAGLRNEECAGEKNEEGEERWPSLEQCIQHLRNCAQTPDRQHAPSPDYAIGESEGM